MADTVKKSRIVSEADQDLEETLLEEFNLRLKKCMSRDNLQDEDDRDPNARSVYENIEIITSNGAETSAPNENFIQNGTTKFLENERENSHINTCELKITHNGHQEKLEVETNSSNVENSGGLTRKTVRTEINLEKDLNNIPETLLSNPSLDLPATETKGTTDIISVKDRMLLSTDNASCLLFTQTITSPMLTPSEENIDFLKGFRRESTQNTISDNTHSSNSPKSEPKLEDEFVENMTNLNTSINLVDEVPRVTNESKDEVIYENIQFLKINEINKHTNPSNILENADNLGMHGNDLKEQTSKFIEKEIYCVEDHSNEPKKQEINLDVKGTSFNESHNQVLENQISKELEFDEIQAETSEVIVDNVKQLKSHFMKNECHDYTANSKIDTCNELNELKSLNIMKQISKFENTSNRTEELSTTCINTNISTVTESRFVETTTEMLSSGETNLKKKKTKKSKNLHEKENISVNECNINEEELFYNVNVKNLCRSFGDLTKIEGDYYGNLRNNQSLRTRSMTDIRRIQNKFAENEFVGVSVRALQEKLFNHSLSIYNRGTLCNVKNSHTSPEMNTVLKSSFSKFDALQKKNMSNSNSKPLDQDHINGNDGGSNCKKCGKAVFQMEKIVAERCIYHRNCFRCTECSKQLLVDNFETHEGTLYCKPHFKSLFAPKAVEDEPVKPRKHEIIICENQPAELPPDVARASDKPNLGLEELHSLNVKERFQVFENAHQTTDNYIEKNAVKMERSPSILSKLARFQAKGMNVGVSDDTLNGIPVEESSSDEEVEEILEDEDADLIRAKRVQKEKPFHFSQMSDVKSKWETGNQLQNRDERREERKQEIQNIRSRLFMGKQGKMKEAYQQAILESNCNSNIKKEVPVEVTDTRSLKDKFEKGEIVNQEIRSKDAEDLSVFESGISKNSRSLFQELDASGGQVPKLSPTTPPKLGNAVRSAREAYLAKQASEDTVKSSDQLDEITIRTSDIQDRFKFFETYKEPQQKRKEFRMTPPREGQNKSATPEREVHVDPTIVRADDLLEDSVVVKTTHTATKMLSKFRQMEEDLQKGQGSQGPKPLKRFTPPREPARRYSTSEEESDVEESDDEIDNIARLPERDLLEAQKAARAKQLRAKFERWEENESEIRKESQVNIVEELGDDQSQVETAKSLRARFESLKETSNQRQSPRVKVNRFVDNIVSSNSIFCESCHLRVYPLERITVHGHIYHRNCFRCKECNAVLRMVSYSSNQGFLYCTTHFKRLFISKGNYDTAFGLDQHKEKWNLTTVA